MADARCYVWLICLLQASKDASQVHTCTLAHDAETECVQLQASMLTMAAMRAGFSGGLVVDFPHSTRAKKHFLVLMVGSSLSVPAPKGLEGEQEEEVAVSQRHSKKRKLHGKAMSGVRSLFYVSTGNQVL